MALLRIVGLPILLLVVPACAPRTLPSASAASSVPPEVGTLITQDQIAASGARTAWDALQLTAPLIHLREARGSAAKIQRRGRSSIYLDDQVRVIVDHVRIPDLQLLQQMAAADIFRIQVLNSLDAATYFGGTSASGVVLITTRAK